jgi:homocysteine S-methyltransferase
MHIIDRMSKPNTTALADALAGTLAEAMAAGPVVLDGGMSNQLEAAGHDLSDELWSARLLVDEPEAIEQAHAAYFAAGAQVAITASYQATFEGLARRGVGRVQAAGLLRRSVELARQAQETTMSVSNGQRKQGTDLSVSGGQSNQDAGLSVSDGHGNQDTGLSVSDGHSNRDVGLSVSDGQGDPDTRLSVSDGQRNQDTGLSISDGHSNQGAGLSVSDGHGNQRSSRWVAASVGPYGAALADGSEYRGRYGLSVAQLENFHRPRIETLVGAAPDVLALETIPDIDEALALLRIVDSLGVPAWLSYTISGDRTRAGQPLDEAFGLAASSSAVIAVGVNCCAPADVSHAVKVASSVTGKPVVVYPNSGEVWDASARSWQGPNTFDAGLVRSWVTSGARLVGGCCRVGPSGIAAIRAALSAD